MNKPGFGGIPENPWQKRGKKYKVKFFAAMSDLYGKEPVDESKQIESNRYFQLKPQVATEDHEQFKAVTWLTKNNILHYHIPNGGRRSMAEGVKFKRLGVKAGIPDLCIPIPRSPYHGLYIELKRVEGGKVSEAQDYWLAELANQGYAVLVAHGAKEAIEFVQKYLGEGNHGR